MGLRADRVHSGERQRFSNSAKEGDVHPNQSHRDYLAQQQRATNALSGTGEVKGGFLRRWLGAIVRQWQRRRMIATLEAMDPRMLRDIGIYPGDIPRVVDGLSDRELQMTPLAPTTSQATRYDVVDRKAA